MEENKPSKLNNGFFKKPDLILYVVTTIIIITLFLSFVIIPKPLEAKGFDVILKGNKIFSFNYSSSQFQIFPFEESSIDVVEGENTFTITLYLNQSRTEYNVLLVNVTNKSVSCIESTCSLRKDCVYTPPILGGSGAIICMPHNLKVLPQGEGYLPVVSG